MCVHVPGAQGNKQAPLTVQCTPGHACACVYVYVTYIRVCYIRVPNCTYACKDPLVCVRCNQLLLKAPNIAFRHDIG